AGLPRTRGAKKSRTRGSRLVSASAAARIFSGVSAGGFRAPAFVASSSPAAPRAESTLASSFGFSGARARAALGLHARGPARARAGRGRGEHVARAVGERGGVGGGLREGQAFPLPPRPCARR